MHKGSGEGSWVLDGVVGAASLGVSSPWWAGGLVAEAVVPSPGEQADDFGKGRGARGLLRLGVVIGSPRLLELALDEVVLQLFPITDHKLFGEILPEQNRTQSSC